MTITVHPNFDQTDNNWAWKLKCISGPALINCEQLIGTFPTQGQEAELWRGMTGVLVSRFRWWSDSAFGLSNSKRALSNSYHLHLIPHVLFFTRDWFFSLISISFSILLSPSIALCLILNPLLLQIWDSGWSSNFSPPDYFTTNGQEVLFKSFHSFIHIHSSIHFHCILPFTSIAWNSFV